MVDWQTCTWGSGLHNNEYCLNKEDPQVQAVCICHLTTGSSINITCSKNQEDNCEGDYIDDDDDDDDNNGDIFLWMSISWYQ